MNILLDLDGTLCDPRDGFVASIAHALDGLGCEAPDSDAIAACIGPPLGGTLARLIRSADPALIARGVALYRERYEHHGIFENTVYDGIPAALAALCARGAALHLATSKPHVFAERILVHFGLREFFRSVHGPELDGTRADKRELIAHLLAHEAIDPRGAVMVGDREHDARGARANGVAAAGVLWGYGSREELETAGVMALLQRPEQLATLLR